MADEIGPERNLSVQSPDSGSGQATPPPAGRWRWILKRAFPLVGVAVVALAGANVVDGWIWDIGSVDRLKADCLAAKEQASAVDARLQLANALDLKLSDLKLSESETAHARSQRVAERITLERHLEDAKKREMAAEQRWRSKSGQTGSCDGESSPLLTRLNDPGTYLHAGFHMAVVGAVLIGYGAIAAALLLLVGGLLTKELNGILDFIADRIRTSGAASVAVPLAAALAGAGAVAAATTTPLFSMPGATHVHEAPVTNQRQGDRSSGDTSNNNPDQRSFNVFNPAFNNYNTFPSAFDPRFQPFPSATLDAMALTLAIQALIERTEKTTHEFKETFTTLREWRRIDRTTTHHVRVDGQVTIADYDKALARLDGIGARLEKNLGDLSTYAGKIAVNTNKTAEELGTLNGATAKAVSETTALHSTTRNVNQHSEGTFKEAECLVKFEQERASRGLFGRLGGFFAGMKVPDGCKPGGGGAATVPASSHGGNH